MKNLIQIAGVIDKEEAQMLMDAGVESKNGRKDFGLVKRFVEESKEAFAKIS
jgi:phosphoribosylanthranilate isomerase